MKQRNPPELWPAIGLVIDQKQIAVCVTAATAKGRREISHEIHDCDDRNQEEIVGRMLERWLSPPGAKRPKRRPWIRLGLPEARVFQAALPITPANHNHTAQNFFLEAVQATNVRAEDRIVELIKVELGGRALACVAASPRNVVESSIGMISRLGGVSDSWSLSRPRSFAREHITAKHRAAQSCAFVSSSVSFMPSACWVPARILSSGTHSTCPQAMRLLRFTRLTPPSG